jgi:rhamnosyltransferase
VAIKKPKISIVIPVKDGEKTIDICLKGIFEQTLIHQTEVIIIDSGSTDKTLEIIKKYPVKLYQIPPKEFGHGKTRNYGASLAKGEFVVMTVQDVRPATNDWLEILLKNFKDKNIVAVTGQQAVPHEKYINPVQWFRPINKPGVNIVQFEKGEFEKLSPKQQRQNCSWDDVNAMYRKSITQKIPFQEVEFGEDMLWAKDALIKGYKIAYDMRAKVWHYHHYTDMDILRQRINYTLYFTYKNFGYILPNSYNFKYFIRLIYMLIKYRCEFKWWIYNLKISLVSYRAYKKLRKLL